MSQISRILLLALALCGAVLPASAQRRLVRQALFVDSLMLMRYRRADVDTSYVMRPPTRFTVTARYNVAGSRFDVEGVYDGRHLHSRLRSDYKSTLSLGVNYLGVSLALALNPAKLLGRYRDYELGLVYYGKHYGGDLIWQEARNYTGYYEEMGQPRLDLPAGNMLMRTLNASGYFVFNHRRFSYPAAMTQGYIQRRSAGSWMLAASVQTQHARYSGDYEIRLRIANLGLGGGYGYNCVPGRGWLIHLSVLPTLIVYNHTALTNDSARVRMEYHVPDVIVTSRAAIVYEVHRNQFLALSGVYYFTDIGGKKHLDIQSNKWRMRLAYGFRF